MCGKTPQFGHNVSHSMHHTNRLWMPNIHPVTLYVDNRPRKMNLCTRCLRTAKKTTKIA